jgi:hypothetical protein
VRSNHGQLTTGAVDEFETPTNRPLACRTDSQKPGRGAGAEIRDRVVDGHDHMSADSRRALETLSADRTLHTLRTLWSGRSDGPSRPWGTSRTGRTRLTLGSRGARRASRSGRSRRACRSNRSYVTALPL